MARIVAQNVLCHENLDIELEPGAVMVTGPNSSGKTSLARVIAACVAWDDDPAGTGAFAKKAYVRDGQVEGVARVDDVSWYPHRATGGIAAPPNTSPLAAPHAVGLVEFTRVRRSVKERAKLWETLFLPEDPEEILRPAWPLAENQLHAILDEIRAHGWEGAAAIYENLRLDAKRRWQDITKDGRYGYTKATEYTPEDWHPEYDGLAESDFVEAVTEAQDMLRALTTTRAVEQHQIDRGRDIIDREIPEIESEIEGMALQIDSARGEARAKAETVRSLQEERGRVSREYERAKAVVAAKPEYECPGCEIGLMLGRGELVRWDAPDPDEQEAARAEMKRLEDEEAALREQVGAAQQAANDARMKSSELMDRRNMFQGRIGQLRREAWAADAEPSPGVSDAARADAETKLDRARRALLAFRQMQGAREAHEKVVEYDAVCTLIGPTGARAQHMGKSMDMVRKVLRNSEKHTGWLPITITEDYSIVSGGRSIVLCAANERMKAEWLLSIAAGMASRSKWIVLDAADVLRGEHWTGLVNLINVLSGKMPDVHFVVCATEAEVPDGWQRIHLPG